MTHLDLVHENLKTDADYRRAYAEEDLIHRVAERVYQIRTKENLTQTRLAELLDTQQPAIARIEGGFENLTLRRVAQVAYALDCRPEDLVKRSKPLILHEGWEREENESEGEVINLFEATVSISRDSAPSVEEDEHLMAAGI